MIDVDKPFDRRWWFGVRKDEIIDQLNQYHDELAVARRDLDVRDGMIRDLERWRDTEARDRQQAYDERDREEEEVRFLRRVCEALLPKADS